ncbi:hypothetical protein K7W42_15660 [Deinococcus sp. HMF7604]|uniref:hypothetical protein n=1 Tax=Deinococcus betulae TaxID=2873312 RepID=UPI001CCB7603|nr:hypothetical protein [Deinococcus betulae]MBZ9752289.1 hypothetical protein [Deinococcus betulae]
MKAWGPLAALLVILAAAAAVLSTTQGQRRSAVETTNSTRETVFTQMQRFAETQLQLTRVDCGEVMTVTPDTPCYVTDLSGSDIQQAMAEQTEARQLTRWRDDYGTLGAGFAWRDTSWRLGVVYERTDSADLEGRPEIQSRKGFVIVTIDTLE